MLSSPSQPIEAPPIGRHERLLRLIAQPFAHRGLHSDGRVENSVDAFLAAAAAGQGIELDVQETADGHALVFHDYDLDRLTEDRGLVRYRTLIDLSAISLRGTGQKLMTLDQCIRTIGDRTSILVEVKSRHRVPERLCRAVLDAIKGKETRIAVMSFNPEVAHWFSRHAPEVLRGLVVSEAGETGYWARFKGGLKRIVSLARARPDFLAYDIGSLPAPLPHRLRTAGMPILTWTVRTAEERARAAVCADQIIHELPRELWPR